MGKVYAVEYKQPNIFTFQFIIPSKHEIEAREAKPKGHKFSAEELRMFNEMKKDKIFKPGINEITEEELVHLKSHPGFEALFDESEDRWKNIKPPVMEWVSGKSPEDYEGAEEEGATLIEGLKEKAALKIVRSTLDMNLLLEWKKKDQREAILKAVDLQLAKLRPGYKQAA